MQTTSIEDEEKNPAPGAADRSGKYLVFHLGCEEYGIPVLKVREIMRVQDITAVPRTPPYIKGVINLRGKVIPVMDLRLKFGLPELEYTQRTCIIVVHLQGEVNSAPMGIVVDGVAEVLSIGGAEIENPPEFGQTPALSLLGMAKVKGKVKILLDIDQVLANQDVLNLNGFLQ